MCKQAWSCNRHTPCCSLYIAWHSFLRTSESVVAFMLSPQGSFFSVQKMNAMMFHVDGDLNFFIGGGKCVWHYCIDLLLTLRGEMPTFHLLSKSSQESVTLISIMHEDTWSPYGASKFSCDCLLAFLAPNTHTISNSLIFLTIIQKIVLDISGFCSCSSLIATYLLIWSFSSIFWSFQLQHMAFYSFLPSHEHHSHIKFTKPLCLFLTSLS